jgi:TorA maturation chaperone TorD
MEATTVTVMNEPLALEARSLVLLVLGRLLTARDEGDAAWLKTHSKDLTFLVDEALIPGGGASPADQTLREAAERVASEVDRASAWDLAQVARRLGHPVPESGVSPYETSHVKGDAFATSQLLADLAGFYRAFGVDLADRRERQDHVAVQLEFLALLAAKEARALASLFGTRDEGGEPESHRTETLPPSLSPSADTRSRHEEGVGIVRDAARAFWKAHTGRFAPAFFSRLAGLEGLSGTVGRFGGAVTAAAMRWWT